MSHRGGAATIALILCLTGGGFLPSVSAADTRPNVLLVSWDTVRSDHLGMYGYPRGTSPNLDRIARRGVVFIGGYAQSPWTLPSHVSAFTSTYSSSHGVDDDGIGMPEDLPFLTEEVKKANYRTGSIVSSAYVGKSYGFDRGFDDFTYIRKATERGTERVTEAALEWLGNVESAGDEAPFFLFLHYLDAHTPYDPPEPLDRAWDRDYQGEITGWPQSFQRYFHHTHDLPPEDLAHLKALYDGEIHRVDSGFGQVIDRIEAMGELDRTLVVVFSDHGEEFKDHGGMDHGYTLYEEAIRVPMIFSCPELLPGNLVLDEFAELVDIMPTMLAILNLSIPSGCHGANLLPLLKPTLMSRLLYRPKEHAYSETTRHRFEIRTVLGRRYKYYKSQSPKKWERMYDLETDPAETEEIQELEEHQEGKQTLFAALGGWLAEALEHRAETQPTEMTEEEVEHLRSIGYTFAGMKKRAQSGLNGPRGMAFGHQGQIYVADQGNHQVKIMSRSGHLGGQIGSGEPSHYEESGQFLEPVDLCIDPQGRIFIIDQAAHSIQVFDPDGEFLARASGGEGKALDRPMGICSDPGGSIYVSCMGSHQILVFDADLNLKRTLGERGRSAGRFLTPCDVTIDGEDRLLVADLGNQRIQVLDPESGTMLREIRMGAWRARSRKVPPVVTVDHTGRILATAPDAGKVVLISAEGKIRKQIAPAEGQVEPSGLGVSPEGTVYVSLYRKAEVIPLEIE